MFSIGKTEIEDSYGAIPSGTYPVYVEKAEFKTSKAGAEYLNVMFKIIGDQYKGRVFFNIYNVMHPTEKVRNIAFADLKKMFLACGVKEEEMDFKTKEELLEKVLTVRCNVKIGITKDPEHGDKNKVNGYEEMSDVSAGATTISADNIPF